MESFMHDNALNPMVFPALRLLISYSFMLYLLVINLDILTYYVIIYWDLVDTYIESFMHDNALNPMVFPALRLVTFNGT